MIGSFTEELFSEPTQSLSSRVVLAGGTGIFLYGVVMIVVASPTSPEYLVMGGALALVGASEAVPPHRVRPAATLRILTLVGFALFAVTVYGQLFSVGPLHTGQFAA